MKNIIEVGLGIIISFFLFSLMNKISFSLFFGFNVFTLVVLYFAIHKGEVLGACLGAFCGLLQDTFSLSVVGVAGLSKTIVGFLAGTIAEKMNVLTFWRSFFFLLVMTSLDLALWSCFYFFIFSRTLNTGGGLIFWQPLITAFLGSGIFRLVSHFKTSYEKKRYL